MIPRYLIVILLVLFTYGSVMAELYHWTDSNGVKHYSMTVPDVKDVPTVSIFGKSPTGLSADVIEYGEFRGVKAGTRGDLNPSTRQSEQDAGIYKGLQNVKVTDLIQGEVGKKFGLRYSVNGSQKGQRQILLVKVLHPAIINPKTNLTKTSTTWKSYPRAGEVHYDGWSFEHPWEVAPGKWTIQLWNKNQKLSEKEFTVVTAQLSVKPGQSSVKVKPAEHKGRYSEWSRPLNGMQIRIRAPQNITPFRGATFQLYVGVEIKNTSNAPLTFTQDARIWATKENTTKRIKCLKNTRVRPTATLMPGESTEWLQEGRLVDSGIFKIFAALQENETISSPVLQTNLKNPPVENIEEIRASLKASVDKLPRIRVNTEVSQINYRELMLNQQPIAINGLLYTGFKFKVPAEGNLVWSFIENAALPQWSILPAKGSMRGFYNFDTRILTRKVDSLGEPGRIVIFQFLQGVSLSPGRKYELEPRKDYIIWFKVTDYNPVQLKLSLNILKDGRPDFIQYFPEIFENSK